MTELRIVRSRRKTLALQVLPTGEILARAPLRLPERDIHAFAEQHAAWLEAAVARARAGSRAAQRAGIQAARAGVSGREVDGAARRVLREAGYGDYFTHSFGHSLGLEIHESPNAAPGEERIMPVGAVVSAEPGIYLPGRFGVRIEDVIVLSETGCRDLTKSPKELIVL